MATCPRCRGHLTDTHRCPKGRLRGALETGAVGLGGGLGGLIVLALLDAGGAARDLEGMAFVAGSLLALGAHAMVRG